MSIENKRNNHMRRSYAKYWIRARSDHYGFMPYDQALIDLVERSVRNKPTKILEVGIGTGWPIAATLSREGQQVFGVDIASSLIAKCNEDWPNIEADVGDAAALRYEDNCFELTYCVHTSWLLPNLTKSIEEMCRVTSTQGSILIDIMNLNNPFISKVYKQHVFENTNLLGKIYKTIKNLTKFIFRRGTQDWPFLISYDPVDPDEIINLISRFGGSDFTLYGWQGKYLKELTISDKNSHDEFDRVVVCCRLQKA